MAVRSADAYAWNPSRNALWSQRWGDYYDDKQNYPTAILLRHPTAPYVDVINKIDNECMQRVSYDYLTAANSLKEPHIDKSLNIPSELLTALAPAPAPNSEVQSPELSLVVLTDAKSFRWLPIGWPPQPGKSNPQTLVSFQAMR
jgi:hypothetical protein